MKRLEKITFDPDCKVLNFIKGSGFATVEQIQSLFFKGREPMTRKKLSILQRQGLIKSMFFIELVDKRTLIPAPCLQLRRKKIYFSGNKEALLKRKRNILIHQILLNASLVRLKNLLSEHEVLFHADLSRLNSGITPDACLRSKDFLIAIELERSPKTISEYFKKANLYKNSTYTHVIYIALNKATKKSVYECFRGNPNTAIFLYDKSFKIYSIHREVMDLKDWISFTLKNSLSL